MQWIDAKDLEHWADRPECEPVLPTLIRRLIRATTPRSSFVDIPSGSGIALGGWDGRVRIAKASAFVPEGTSAWEMSRRTNKATKAREDFDKRTADPGEIDPVEATFIFVTPRVWARKSKFANESKAKGHWRDVRVYDANDLAQWIDLAPSVGAWLAREIGKIPHIGILSLDEFWEEWSQETSPPISPALVVSGRDVEMAQISKWIEAEPAQYFVKANTNDESIAFLASSALLASADWGHEFLSRCLILRNGEAWRALSHQSTPLILIPNFEGSFSPSVAIGAGHHVVVPIVKGEKEVGPGLVLSRLGRKPFIENLQIMGLTENDAENLARSTGRDLPVLRRRLIGRAGAPQPAWATPPTAPLLIPALLAGQWTESMSGDREFLAKLVDKEYAELTVDYIGLLNLEDSPIRKIGNNWKLISHEEAWELLSPYLTPDHVKRFQESAIDLLSHTSPQFDLPKDERFMAGVTGRKPSHSGILRSGVSRTLALMGCRPQQEEGADNTEAVANQIVRNVLAKANDWRVLATLGSDLAVLAEAAPDTTLAKLGEAFDHDPNPYLELFKEEDGGIFGSCPHSGLLWALERLAWSAAHFTETALLLARLSSIDPGGQYANRPMNSLRELFLAWLRFTLATDGVRLTALDRLLEQSPEVGWKLLLEISPRSHNSASNHTMPEWRDWAQDAVKAPTHVECLGFYSEIILRLLENVGEDVNRWKELIDAIPAFPPEQRRNAIKTLMRLVGKIKTHPGATGLWKQLRKVLNRHRRFPGAGWAMPKKELNDLTEIYDELTPSDPVTSISWLFDYWPNLPEGESENYKKHQERIQDARDNALKHLMSEHGIAIMIALSKASSSPSAVALTAVRVETDRKRLIILANLHLASADRKCREFARAVYGSVLRKDGWDAIELCIAKLEKASRPSEQIAEIYLSAPADMQTWKRLENENSPVQEVYWTNLEHAFRIKLDDASEISYASEKLLDYGRALLVVELLAHSRTPIPSLILLRALEQAPAAILSAEKEGKPSQIDTHDLAQIFEKLDKADDVSREMVARLEIPFVSLLTHDRPVMALHKEVVDDPTTFADFVSWAFKRADHQPDDELLEDTERENRARLAFEVLFHLRRLPGQDEDGSVDEEKLTTWVEEARELCRERGREETGDEIIGEILANAPDGSDGAWPCKEIRNVLDRVASKHIGLGFIIGKKNLRGTVTRSPFSGGEQERHLATAFQRDADIFAGRWPLTARLLRAIAASYAEEAKREDNEAEWRDQSE